MKHDMPILLFVLIVPFALIGVLWGLWHFWFHFMPFWWDMLKTFAVYCWETR